MCVRRAVVGLLGVLILWGGHVHAQVGADSGTTNIIEQQGLDANLREDLVRSLATRPAVPETGTAKDLFLLQRNKIFYLNVTPSVTATNNAFYQPGKRSDELTRYRLAAGVNTVVDGRYRVNLNLNHSTARYSHHQMLNYDDYGVGVGISTSVGPLVTGVNYSHNTYTRPGLVDIQQLVDTGAVYVSFSTLLSGQIGFSMYVSGDHTFVGGPIGYQYSSVLLSPSVSARLTDTVTVQGSVFYLQKYYQDYFTDVFDNQTRRDRQRGLSLRLSYRPPMARWLSVSGSFRYSKNQSTLEVLEFESVNGTGVLSLTARF